MASSAVYSRPILNVLCSNRLVLLGPTLAPLSLLYSTVIASGANAGTTKAVAANRGKAKRTQTIDVGRAWSPLRFSFFCIGCRRRRFCRRILFFFFFFFYPKKEKQFTVTIDAIIAGFSASFQQHSAAR